MQYCKGSVGEERAGVYSKSWHPYLILHPVLTLAVTQGVSVTVLDMNIVFYTLKEIENCSSQLRQITSIQIVLCFTGFCLVLIPTHYRMLTLIFLSGKIIFCPSKSRLNCTSFMMLSLRVFKLDMSLGNMFWL